MKLCDFCGFVLSESDAECKNCSNTVPGKEHLLQPKEPSFEIKETPKTNIRLPKPNGLNLSRYIPKKTIIILLIVGFAITPQAQTLISESSNYWDEMNTPYYNIPESIEITLVRNFTIYLETDGTAEYKLILSKPENRPSWPQQDHIPANAWQTIKNFQVNPQYEENEAGRMEWSGEVSGNNRNYVEVEYTINVNTLRPDLKIEDSGKVNQIPSEVYDSYLQPEWLIEPNLTSVIELAENMTLGTDGNVIHILKNIYDYIQNNYTYQKSSVPKTCTESMAKKIGDCDDFSILFASIARAAGIPTWIELGKIPAFIDTRSGCDLNDWGGHAWINALVPLSDGSVTTVSIDLANSYFMWMPPYRISDWVDDGNGDNLYSYYYLFSSQGTGRATYIENTYVSNCEISGNIKLEEL